MIKKILCFVLLVVMLSGGVVSADSRGLVWVVSPMLEYEHIYYCNVCDIFSTEQHSGMAISMTTGELIGEAGFSDHCGDPVWVFDYERNLFGDSGMGRGMNCADEWEEHFPRIANRLIIVERVEISTYPNDYCQGIDICIFTGKFAVMYNGKLITDFIFDGGDIRGRHGGFTEHGNINSWAWFALDSVAMRIGTKWGMIDRDGMVAIPFVFDRIVHIDGDTVFARYNGRYGILNVPLTMANTEPTPAPETVDNIYWLIAALLLIMIIFIKINKNWMRRF